MDKQPILCSSYRSSLEEQVTACTLDGSLVGLTLGEDPGEKLTRKLCRQTGRDSQNDPVFPAALRRQLEQYFAGKLREFTYPLTLLGTPFQKQVWEALRRVPYGSTVSYQRLGELAGVSGSRAVGGAMAANPICILVPCHRVLPSSGGMGNYSAGQGPATKRALLALEGVVPQGGKL